jgi:hypothetical protein
MTACTAALLQDNKNKLFYLKKKRGNGGKISYQTQSTS